MSAPLLEVKNLRVEFPTRRGTLLALDDISFDIAPGEVLGVVGESGAGKSLTGAAIIGLLEPPGRIAGGEIRWPASASTTCPTSRCAPSAAAHRRHLPGPADLAEPAVHHRPAAHRDHPHAPAGQRGRSAPARDPLLQETGIPAPKSASTSTRTSSPAACASAWSSRWRWPPSPKLIVADEPTTALDVSIQAQIIALLKRLCKDHGAAVMLVTHDMGVIAETCDRVAVMYAGRICRDRPGARRHPPSAHPYTAGLMGSIPAMDDDRERLLQIDGAMPRLNAIPAGCAFNPRCPQVMERCRRRPARLSNAGRTHAACWLHAQEPAE
jgi:peptide/nickel transport system ATP-binding protein